MSRLNEFPQWVDAPEPTGAEALLPSDDPDGPIETGDDSEQGDLDGDIPF